jgi:hypothetical protein
MPLVFLVVVVTGSFWVPAKGGQRFLVGVQVTKAAPAPIQVVLNWNEAARNQK